VSFVKFILVVEYQGTRYHGSQWQAKGGTIQGVIEEALSKICKEHSRVMMASRTDAGVHARGQVASVWAETKLTASVMMRALNHYLPGDVVVKEAYGAGADFSVRKDAISREYRYDVFNGDTRSPFARDFALFLFQELDVLEMNRACQFLLGEHDFSSFASAVKEKRKMVRTVYNAEVKRSGKFVIFDMEASSFLPHQVRNTVGLLLRVGRGKVDVERFCHIMEARESGMAGPTVPACGLCLTKVNYARPLEDMLSDTGFAGE
jgi:tRNA pseudouridine38-40 synthase